MQLYNWSRDNPPYYCVDIDKVLRRNRDPSLIYIPSRSPPPDLPATGQAGAGAAEGEGGGAAGAEQGAAQGRRAHAGQQIRRDEL